LESVDGRGNWIEKIGYTPVHLVPSLLLRGDLRIIPYLWLAGSSTSENYKHIERKSLLSLWNSPTARCHAIGTSRPFSRGIRFDYWTTWPDFMCMYEIMTPLEQKAVLTCSMAFIYFSLFSYFGSRNRLLFQRKLNLGSSRSIIRFR